MQNGNGNWLQCLDAQTGKVIWSSRPGQLGKYNFAGNIELADNALYAVAAKGQSDELSLLAIDPQKGALFWQAPFGNALVGTDFRGQRTLPSPVLKFDDERLWVLTNNGALLAFDPTSHAVSWGLRTDAPEVVNRSQMVFFNEARR